MSGDKPAKETATAYAAFLEYCEMGRGRSLPGLARKFGESSEKVRSLQRLYERWSSAHRWQERVKQYDQEQALARAAKKQVAREAMEDRHAEEAKEEQGIARKLLKDGAKKGRVSIAAVQLLKNSREDERKALADEGVPLSEQGSGAIVGIAVVYLPQKHMLPKKGGDADASSES